MSSVQDLLIPAAVVGLVLMVASGGGSGGAPAKADPWGGLGEYQEVEIFEAGEYGGGHFPSRAQSEMTAPIYAGSVYPLSSMGSMGNVSEIRFERNFEQAKESNTVTDNMCLFGGQEIQAIEAALVVNSRQWSKTKQELTKENVQRLATGINDFTATYCDQQNNIMSNYLHTFTERYNILMAHASDETYAIGDEEAHDKVSRGRTASNIQTIRSEIAKVQELYLEVLHGAKDTIQEYRLHTAAPEPLERAYQEDPQENPIDIGTAPNFTSVTSMAGDLMNRDIPAQYDSLNDSMYSLARPQASLSSLHLTHKRQRSTQHRTGQSRPETGDHHC